MERKNGGSHRVEPYFHFASSDVNSVKEYHTVQAVAIFLANAIFCFDVDTFLSLVERTKVTGIETAASEKDGEKIGGISNDDLIIEQILAGDADLYEEIIFRYKRRVFSIARHFFRSPETVEDIVQETFTKAYFSLGTYRRGATCEQWLARIAVNNCYDELRRRKKRGESLITDLTENETAFLETRMAGMAFAAKMGEAERERAAEIAEKLLGRLSPEDRLVMTLLHCEENSVRDISRLTGWSEAKVKIRAFRARNVMRRVLARLKLTERRLSGG